MQFFMIWVLTGVCVFATLLVVEKIAVMVRGEDHLRALLDGDDDDRQPSAFVGALVLFTLCLIWPLIVVRALMAAYRGRTFIEDLAEQQRLKSRDPLAEAEETCRRNMRRGSLLISGRALEAVAYGMSQLVQEPAVWSWCLSVEVTRDGQTALRQFCESKPFDEIEEGEFLLIRKKRARYKALPFESGMERPEGYVGVVYTQRVPSRSTD